MHICLFSILYIPLVRANTVYRAYKVFTYLFVCSYISTVHLCTCVQIRICTVQQWFLCIHVQSVYTCIFMYVQYSGYVRYVKLLQDMYVHSLCTCTYAYGMLYDELDLL